MSVKLKKDSVWPKVILILAIILGGWYFTGGKKVLVQQPVKEDVAQLSSVEKYIGMATASRSYDKKAFNFSITAFLPKPTGANSYYVWLKDDARGLTVLLGKLEAKGDVYALSYSSENDLREYKTVVVAEQKERELLKGSF